MAAPTVAGGGGHGAGLPTDLFLGGVPAGSASSGDELCPAGHASCRRATALEDDGAGVLLGEVCGRGPSIRIRHRVPPPSRSPRHLVEY
ncbi:hypothetical protein IscW_ISCW019688 [Ixodes scapularis]|uniref:Uncharacterized protein n=1 Tax=Ixodes scapularis TaxID=6945 RepID=B7PVZ8_IXOSC|nr:hypothetical protein IscW_ISCW019688 [Ixodes scapularis]|eukprot:XP_002408898.1 hypothetical protein IscW_ISCW019688 [Ixodes scapularis]